MNRFQRYTLLLMAGWLGLATAAWAQPDRVRTRGENRRNNQQQNQNQPQPRNMPAPAQGPGMGAIAGMILDRETGEGLPSAAVLLPGTGMGVLAGPDGSFNLPNVPAGDVLVRVYMMGFVDTTFRVNVQAGAVADVGQLGLLSDAIGIEEIKIIASYARDRQTPVAISTVDAAYRAERLGAQELPALLKLTPSVYTSNVGGGFGDSRIAIRGFQQEEVAVLINGIPINDMNGGRVFWSNWLGLGDVVRTLQVQRGLGATRLAISSIGGTMNLITRTTDMQRGGSVTLETGNVYQFKSTFSLSTGRTAKGMAATFVGSRTLGTGYIDRTDIDAWSYFFSLSQEIGRRHLVSFTAFGAPQSHGQRFTSLRADQWQNRPSNRFNPDWGYYNGEPMNSATNFYHKPQLSLNHSWEISNRTSLNTSVYASWGRGGGTGYNSQRPKTGSAPSLGNTAQDSLQNWGSIQAFNRGTAPDTVLFASTGTREMLGHRSFGLLRASYNNHNWYGVLSTLKHKLTENITLLGGIDARVYTSEHYRQIVDLLGGDFFLEQGYAAEVPYIISQNDGIRDTVAGRITRVGDIIDYHYSTAINWYGGFLTAEYNSDKFSAFVSGSISNTYMRRFEILRAPVTKKDTASEALNFIGFNAKGGASYRITQNHNVFVNAGYLERAPFYRYVFRDERTSNDVLRNPTTEKILSLELGYNLTLGKLAVNLNGYYTQWRDKGLRTNFTRNNNTLGTANISGVEALHMGAELDFHWNFHRMFTLTGMFSYGDWKWQDNVMAIIQDEQVSGQVDTVFLPLKGVAVGNAAQTTAALGLRFQPTPAFYLSVDGSYFDRLYANFDPEARAVQVFSEAQLQAVQARQAWRMPSFWLLDAHAGYNFTIGNTDATLRASVVNLLDKAYFMEGQDGARNDQATSRVFYGFGRTFNLALTVRF